MQNSVLRTGVRLMSVLILMASAAFGQSASDLARKLDLLKAYPDVVVVNGAIHTMDGSSSQVQAMAVKNSRILALGTNDQMRFLAGPSTQIIDAKGRTVLPALVDSHTHPNLWGVLHWLGAKGPDMAKEFNMPELASTLVRGNDTVTVLKRLEQTVYQRAKELGPGKWIVIYLFGEPGNTLESWEKLRVPLLPRARAGGGGTAAPLNREFLNTLAPQNPLIVFIGSGMGDNVHNTRAAQEWIKIVGNEQTQGLMEAPQLMWDILLRGHTDVAMAIMKRELLECIAAQGIGTFGDRYDRSVESAKVLRLLYDKGELPTRWGYFVSSGSNTIGKYEKLAGTTRDQVALFVQKVLTHEIPDFRGVGSDFIWMAGTANEAWEGGLTCTKAERPPESARKPDKPWEIFPDCATPIDYDKLEGYKTEKEIMDRGLRMGFLHGYSDGTYDALFRMLDKAVADGQMTVDEIRQLRIGTEHNPIIRPDQVAKFGKYNIMPSFNGYQVQGDIKGGAFLKTYGEKFISWMAPAKSLVDANVHVVFNTDAHLTDIGPEWKSMESPEQWRGSIWAVMEFFLTRYMPSEGITYDKAQALNKEQMMKAATIWSSELLMREKQIGSLEPGKMGDFIVIDKDYFAIPADQVHTIKTLLTVVGGKTVFKAANF